jgi:hypothetical protein
MKKIAIISLIFTFFSGQAFAIDNIGAVSTTGDIKARIIKALEVVQNQELDFGSFLAKNGIISLSSDGIVTSPEGVAIFSTPTPRAGKFHVTGEPDFHYSFNLPTETILNKSGSEDEIKVTFHNPVRADLQLNSSGENDVYVGADLEVKSSLTPGEYTGNYQVTVNY